MLTAAAAETLPDAALLHLVGHELGHHALGHLEGHGLLHPVHDNTPLPALLACLLQRWRRKAEISADRLGFVASGDLTASLRCLVQATIGLSPRNLADDPLVLAEQQALPPREAGLPDGLSPSHPPLQLRLRALRIFGDHWSRRRTGRARSAAWVRQVDAEVDRLVRRAARGPRTPLDRAVMRLLADAGLEIIAGDGRVVEEEAHRIVRLLHRYYTDAPERLLLMDADARRRRLTRNIGAVRRLGRRPAALAALSRLADLAISDGRVLPGERDVLMTLGRRLGLDEAALDNLMLGALHHAANAVKPSVF